MHKDWAYQYVMDTVGQCWEGSRREYNEIKRLTAVANSIKKRDPETASAIVESLIDNHSERFLQVIEEQERKRELEREQERKRELELKQEQARDLVRWKEQARALELERTHNKFYDIKNKEYLSLETTWKKPWLRHYEKKGVLRENNLKKNMTLDKEISLMCFLDILI